MEADIRYVVVFYDKPKGQNDRQPLAMVTVHFDVLDSLVASLDGNHKFPATLTPNQVQNTPIGGKTILERLRADNTLNREYLGARYDDYLNFCGDMNASLLGPMRLASADELVLRHALLTTASGGRAARQGKDICPDSDVQQAMTDLGLAKLPVQVAVDLETAQRAQQLARYKQFATALMQGKGLAQMTKGIVTFKQAIRVYDKAPGGDVLPVNEDFDMGGDELEELLANPKPSRIPIFDFDGQSKTSGYGIMVLQGKRYKLRIQVTGDDPASLLIDRFEFVSLEQ